MTQKIFWLGLAPICLAGLTLLGCSEASVSCETDADCGSNMICQDGVCKQVIQDEPDGGSSGDPGGDPGSDPGSDPGGDPGGGLLISPGSSVGPAQVSRSQQNFTTLGDIRSALGEVGQIVQGRNFSLSFMQDQLWVTGIDVNEDQEFDVSDHVISVTARTGLAAATLEGLGPGSTLAQVRAQPAYQNPDNHADIPAYGDFGGGKMDFFFGRGLFITYDNSDTATAFTVIRSYPQVPDATINPGQGTLTFGATTIIFGDGYLVGSKREVHQTILGQPDWGYRIQAQVETDYGTQYVWVYTDSYRILGMEFVGGDDTVVMVVVDRLLACALYPPFYGRTAAGHGLGDTKAEWESELGSPVDTFQDPSYDGTLYIYQPSIEHKFGIIYTNNGASPTDISVIAVLNYLTTE